VVCHDYGLHTALGDYLFSHTKMKALRSSRRVYAESSWRRR
jgi:hypothetical protein